MYCQLSKVRKEIRVFSIVPDQDPSNPLKGTLSTVSLLDGPVYQALSYVWGNASNTTTITVDGEPYEVTNNLNAALKRLRNSWERGKNYSLWVDAICIDQKSTEEKNHQVPLMRDIYRQAQTTFAWLGEENNDCYLAFRLLRRWAAVFRESRKLVSGDEYTVLQNHPEHRRTDQGRTVGIGSELAVEFIDLLQRKTRDFIADKVHNAFDKSEYKALSSLFRRLYWSRVWVIQEFVLSPNLVLIVGRNAISYGTFKSGYEALNIGSEICGLTNALPKEHMIFISGSQCGLVSSLIKFKTRCKDGNDIKLWEILTEFMSRKATNPIDSVYALFGLISSCDIPVSVDYSRTAVQVFTDLALAFINDPSIGLNCLCLAGNCPEGAGTSILPSWVPDFANHRIRLFKSKEFYDWSDSNLSAEAVVTRKTLELNGSICCEVQDVRHWGNLVNETLDEWLQMAIGHSKYHPSGLPNLQVFFRTWVMDDSGFGISQQGFRSEVHQLVFFRDAAGYLQGLSSKVKQDLLKNSIPHRPHTSDWSTGLSLFLEVDELTNLLQPEIPASFLDLAIWMKTSPLIQLKHATVATVLSEFCGCSKSNQMLSYPGFVDLFRGQQDWNFFGEYIATSRYRNDTFFVTKTGYMGLGPPGMNEGDTICCIPGCRYPLAIRPLTTNTAANKEHFQLIGPCYIYGMMNGEPANDPEMFKGMCRIVLE